MRRTLSRRDKNEMKSAHSLTLSKDCRHRSICTANFLYLASLASKDVAAAVISAPVDLQLYIRRNDAPLPIRRRCSGVVRPLLPGPASSAYAVTCEVFCEAVELLRDRPGSISAARRPCDAGRRRVRPAGEEDRDSGEDEGPASAPDVTMFGISDMVAIVFLARLNYSRIMVDEARRGMTMANELYS